MNIKPLVEKTIDRLQPRLSQLRKAVQNRKPKDLVTPERLARRARCAAALRRNQSRLPIDFSLVSAGEDGEH